MNIKEKLHLEINKLPFIFQVMKKFKTFFVMRISFQTVLIKVYIGDLENRGKYGLLMFRHLFDSLPSWYRPHLLPDLNMLSWNRFLHPTLPFSSTSGLVTPAAPDFPMFYHMGNSLCNPACLLAERKSVKMVFPFLSPGISSFLILEEVKCSYLENLNWNLKELVVCDVFLC